MRCSNWICVLALLMIAGVVQADWPVDDQKPLQTVGTDFELADGPAWDGAGSLYIPDVKGATLYRKWWKQPKAVPWIKDAGRISASFYNHGQLYLSDNGNARIGILRGKKIETLLQLEADERPNDLVVDNAGGVYVTLTKQGQVIYINTDGERSVAVDGIKTPNGIILSPDEKTLYVSAYVPKKIMAYNVTSPGTTDKEREFAFMDDGPEKGADGMSIDRAGNVYCAGATSVWIWSPSGKELAQITTPTRPINCTFGGNTMDQLFITCFGGVYMQPMLVTGRPVQPPSTPKLQPPGNQNRPSTAIPESMEFRPDVVYAEYGERKLLMDLFLPSSSSTKATEAKPSHAIVLVHGGGWLKGDKTKFRALAIEIAKQGFVVASIEYRLGREAAFPAGMHDCSAAVRYLRAHSEVLNINKDQIGAVGGSAGGHLVGLMATGSHLAELQGEGGNSDQSSRIQAAIVMAGPMEMTTGSVAERSRTSAQSNANAWLRKTVDEAPELYKLADAHVHISKESAPILFMVGEHDNPARNAPSREKLKAAGVWTDVNVYKDGKHGCWNQKPWIHAMAADMGKFFRERFEK